MRGKICAGSARTNSRAAGRVGGLPTFPPLLIFLPPAAHLAHGTQVFVRDSSMVPAFAMLLFGGDMKVYHEEGLVKLDEWAAFKVPARVAVLLQQLRSEVGRLLEAKMEDTSLDLSASALSDAVFQLLETDGF